MKSKRMLMGAAVIGCLAAAMTPGAYAQEANTNGQLNARSGHQPAASARTSGSIRQGQSAGTNAQLNARTNSNATSANSQFERRGLANESRMRASAREGRGYAQARAVRGERGLYARTGVEGGYRGSRVAYRDRAVGTGGVAAADYGYRQRRLYAYAPAYDTSYAAAPAYSYPARYSYAPGYNVGVNTGPYYTPGWNTAYAGPGYDYAPGFSIGIGPVGIGIGPAWGW
jgi:hypothetical protein